mmetsp:Transcript_4038/g.5985  ORF Transcript_4038/g.5985 Transcript_4038/m.5985 type:complete len:232 (+) Transcript_4038:481-1176(+)
MSNWSKVLHSRCIASATSKIHTNLSRFSNRDTVFISALTEIKENLESNRKATNKICDDKDKGFDKLDESFRNMILNASASSPFDKTATTPSAFCTQFSIWSQHILWSRREFPSNFSIFYCADEPLGASSSYQHKALGLMDKIEHADLAKLIKQQIMVPKTIYEAIQSLKKNYALATLLFTEKSHLCIMLSTWVDHLLTNHRIYEFQQQSDPNFIAAFLFKIDKAASIFPPD